MQWLKKMLKKKRVWFAIITVAGVLGAPPAVTAKALSIYNAVAPFIAEPIEVLE